MLLAGCALVACERPPAETKHLRVIDLKTFIKNPPKSPTQKTVLYSWSDLRAEAVYLERPTSFEGDVRGVYVLSGSGAIETNGQKFPLTEEQLIAVPAGLPLTIEPGGKGLRMLMFSAAHP